MIGWKHVYARVLWRRGGCENGVCAALILGLILFAAPALAKTIQIRDQAGRTVTVPHDPERIICLGPGALRLIVYLQAQEKVCGVETMEKNNPGGRPYWLASPELAELPGCGPGGPAAINKKPDLEAILSVNPQVMFITYMDAALADEVQTLCRVPVVVLSYGAFATFDEAVFDALKIAGKVLNRDVRAGAVVNYIGGLRQDLGRRTTSIAQADHPGVYVGGIGYRGAKGLESTEQNYIPFKWIHARNLAGQVPSKVGNNLLVDKEMLLALNPEVIFIDGGGLDLVEADYRKHPQFYKSLSAVQNRRIRILLPFNYYTTNIGTAMADAYAIGKILYPERFTDIDPEANADRIYEFLVGKPVYDAMAAQYGAIGQVAEFIAP